MQNFNFGCWVIGWICFAFQLACLVFAVIQFIVAVTNQSGRHTCAFGVPLGCACPATHAANARPAHHWLNIWKRAVLYDVKCRMPVRSQGLAGVGYSPWQAVCLEGL